ncbi:hypothetical protein M413DRAFT_390842 [Hebeloma cylindrosporum]|uniref:Uncharacterized protein n=1 Tax=Hebeloma cylindrosporum TaxID=76867 RepID=A0A0C2XA49_HEBCY|nr:hypothetical protein M413DRAFT_390842 [Hebeloma cylindrosporum h7]
MKMHKNHSPGYPNFIFRCNFSRSLIHAPSALCFILGPRVPVGMLSPFRLRTLAVEVKRPL